MKDFEDIPFAELAHLEPKRAASARQSRAARVHDPELPFDDKTVKTFFEHVVKSPHGCWLWVGSISSPDGYGRFTWQRGNRQRTVAAHRFALLVAGESFSAREVAEHECNEPLCVRVGCGHVRKTTQRENLRYAVALGRHTGNRVAVTALSSRVERSRRIRNALRDGWDERRYREAIFGVDSDQQTLF